MGQFSWITQDTNESVRESFGCEDQSLTTAYLHDDKGNVWEEKSCEGYGEFGGKDFYTLLAEMNDFIEGDGSLRSVGLDIEFGDIKVDNIKFPNITRKSDWTWINEKPKGDRSQGWG